MVDSTRISDEAADEESRAYEREPQGCVDQNPEDQLPEAEDHQNQTQDLRLHLQLRGAKAVNVTESRDG